MKSTDNPVPMSDVSKLLDDFAYDCSMLEDKKLNDEENEKEYDRIATIYEQEFTALFASQEAELLERIKQSGLYTDRLSYKPDNLDSVKVWPIVSQPCYVIPANILDTIKSELKEKES